jgi:hypothetical protein
MGIRGWMKLSKERTEWKKITEKAIKLKVGCNANKRRKEDGRFEEEKQLCSCQDSNQYRTTCNPVTTSRSALFWLITPRVVVISCLRFGTTYWSHLQSSQIQNIGKKLPLLAA